MATGQRPESVTELIKVLRVSDIPRPDGDTGEGIKFLTNRGELKGIMHQAENATQAVVWVCGARGGFGGPGPGTYARLSEQLTSQGITSLRLDYRFPNDLLECVLDLLVGVGHLKDHGYGPAVVVGHSFGGAVVIAAGATSDHIKGVVSLSPQTYGAGMAGQLAPRKLLVAPRQGRHAPALLLRPSDLRMGQGTQGSRAFRGRRAQARRVPRRAGDPPLGVDPGHPERRDRDPGPPIVGSQIGEHF